MTELPIEALQLVARFLRSLGGRIGALADARDVAGTTLVGLGYDRPAVGQDLSIPSRAIASGLAERASAIDEWGSDPRRAMAAALDVGTTVMSVLASISEAAPSDPAGLRTANERHELCRRLVARSLVAALDHDTRWLLGLLRLVGCVRETPLSVRDGTRERVVTVDVVDLESIANLFDVRTLRREVYGLDGDAPRFDILFRGLAELLSPFPLLVSGFLPVPERIDADARGATAFHIGFPGPGGVADGAGIFLYVLPRPAAQLRIAVDSGVAPGTYSENAGFAVTGSAVVDVDVPAGASSSHVRGSISADVALGGPSGNLSVDTSGGVRLVLEGAHATVGVRTGPTGRTLMGGAGVRRAVLERSRERLDAFARSAVTQDARVAVEDLGIEWGSAAGLRLKGGALEVVVGTRDRVGPVRVTEFRVRLAGGPGSASLRASLALAGAFGPISFSLAGLGAAFVFGSREAASRDFSVVGIQASPPTGVSLSLSAGPVTGAGSLSFDADAGRYSGSVNLRVGPVALNAFGLIETRAPGITGGYSMVFLVAAGFPGIPLPFGFTLDGVGGVCGIHRTISTEAISQGLRAGTLGGIFFPDNPERNATRILSTLGRVFPPAQDRYTFGPAFKIGWGRPQILDAEIALVVSLPAPIQIHLLGNVVLRVPRVANPIVQLKLAVHGWLDTGAKEFGIDGHLYDSRIALFSISGDLAFRLNWGERPSFLLSIGGFHPEFRAPQGFPTLDRVRFVLGAPSGNPGLTLEAYFAVTSNSLQLGARGEIRAEVREIGTGIRGSAHFDALVIFDPFGFTASMGASLCVRLFGVPLVGISAELTVSGPTPWHIVGDARITVVFDIPFHLDLTFGEARREPAETIRGWDDVLRAEIENPSNWTSELAPGAEPAVSFASRPEGEAHAPLDPSGTLVFVQKRLPLNRPIVKVGERRLAGDEREFDVTDVRLGGRHVQTSVRQEHFAPGQYFDLTNDEKTRRPSFERMDAGFAVGAATVRAGPAVVSPIEYEVIPGHLPGAPHTTYLPSAQEVDLGVALAASNGAGANGTKQFASEPGAPKKFVYREATYTIATTDTLTPFLALGGEGEFGAVQERLAAFEQEHPEHRGALQVVPTWEVAA